MINNIYKTINNKLSLSLFGNPNRFNYNLFNFFYKHFICKKNTNVNKNINNLIHKGYFKSNKVSDEFINFMKENIINRINFDKSDHLNKKKISLNIEPSLRGKIIQFIKSDLKEDLLALENYYNNKITIGEIYAQRNLPLDNDEYYKKYTRTKEFEFYSCYYHVDHYVNTHLKMWINLQDVNKENGPLHIYSKPSTRKFIKYNKYKNRNNYKANELENDLYINSGKIGETLFANTTECLHRAGIPEKNYYRDMLFVSFIFVPKKITGDDLHLDYYHKINQNLVWVHDGNNIVYKTKPKRLKDVVNLFKKYYSSKII